MNPSDSLQVSVQSSVTVISTGASYENLDDSILWELKAAILDAVNDAEPPLVVIDLSNTKFFGSAFIEILFRAANRLKSRVGGEFVIAGLTEYCLEVIRLMNLDKIWEIHDSVDEAVSVLANRLK